MAPDDPDRDVLKSLPRTRPQRRSAKRDAARGKAATPAKAKAKPAAKAAAKPKPAARKAPASLGAKRAQKARSKTRRMPPAGFAPPRATEDQGPPSGAELIGTAIQAAAELAQIGLAVGGHAVRSALDRLPKP